MTRTPNLEARERILQKAIGLIHDRGFREVSMEQVAEAAGLKKANLFHYYPTKEELGLAALDLAVRQQREKVADRFSRAPGDPVETIAGMFSEVAEGMRKTGCSRGCLIGNLAQELSDHDEQFRRRLHEHFEFWSGEIADMLERARRAGYFRKEFRTKEAATAILSLFEGAMTLSRAKKDPGVVDGAGRMATEYLRRWKG